MKHHLNSSPLKRPHRSGFGLVEMIIALGIIGMITALAAPMIGMLRDSAGTEKSKRNAHHLASLAATAIAAGDQTIPAAGNTDTAIQLLVEGVRIDDILDGMMFQLDLDRKESEAAAEFLKFHDGVLVYVEQSVRH